MEDIKQNNINLRANNYHPKSEKEKINPKKNKTGKNLFLNEELPQNSILFNVNYKPDIIINHQTSNNFRTNINLQPCPSYSKTEYNQKNYSSQNQYYTIDASNNNFNKRNRVEESPILNNGFIAIRDLVAFAVGGVVMNNLVFITKVIISTTLTRDIFV